MAATTKEYSSALDCTIGFPEEKFGLVKYIETCDLHLLHFRNSDELASYIAEFKNVQKKIKDLNGEVIGGKLTQAEYDRKLQNEWIPLVNNSRWPRRRAAVLGQAVRTRSSSPEQSRKVSERRWPRSG